MTDAPVAGLSARIRAELEGRIRSGEWPPGHRLPIEQALMAQYGCARMTVSKAVAALAEDGLVERRRKAGTFVAQPRVQTAVLAIPDIGALIEARGEAYAFRLIARRIRRPSRDPGEAALKLSGHVLALEGLHMAAGRPFGLERRIICLAHAPEAADADFAAVAPGAWLLAHVPWSEARHRISAMALEPADARTLEIAPATACLQVERWTWRMGEAVTFVRQTFPGDRFDLVADFAPGRP